MDTGYHNISILLAEENDQRSANGNNKLYRYK